MRYRITNLTSAEDSKTTDTHNKPAAVDIEAVNEAVARAAARGESLYIRPVRPSDISTVAEAPAEPQII
ncbi:MAG TPA: hypothetical protein VLH10_02580 [Yinghuangia sp.]|uniref:hypothetical protein n=1 Tax=Yinghuangia sp. YIM S10712 TaxID=3436930 RepID=UPI002D0C9A7D|nr:hypothetical protein [Yinghuangia sp.]